MDQRLLPAPCMDRQAAVCPSIQPGACVLLRAPGCSCSCFPPVVVGTAEGCAGWGWACCRRLPQVESNKAPGMGTAVSALLFWAPVPTRREQSRSTEQPGTDESPRRRLALVCDPPSWVDVGAWLHSKQVPALAPPAVGHCPASWLRPPDGKVAGPVQAPKRSQVPAPGAGAEVPRSKETHTAAGGSAGGGNTREVREASGCVCQVRHLEHISHRAGRHEQTSRASSDLDFLPPPAAGPGGRRS